MLKVVIEKRKDFYFPLADKHFLGGEYQEPHRTNSLSFVDNFGVAMDIGAHVGTWAVDLVQKFDKVICFEPILEHRICLERNLEKFSKDKYPPIDQPCQPDWAQQKAKKTAHPKFKSVSY